MKKQLLLLRPFHKAKAGEKIKKAHTQETYEYIQRKELTQSLIYDIARYNIFGK